MARADLERDDPDLERAIAHLLDADAADWSIATGLLARARSNSKRCASSPMLPPAVAGCRLRRRVRSRRRCSLGRPGSA
jgi:hypothetical protein